MDDLAPFCCLNPDCKDHGRRGDNHHRVHSRCGPQKQYRILECRTCGGRASVRKGTPLSRAHLPEEKAVSILEHLDEGCGVRPTERLVKVHRDTVMRYGRLAGRHASDAHDGLVAFPPNTREAQFDEDGSFVAKTEENCDPEDPADRQKGDWWDHKGDDPEHRLVVCVAPGARNAENAEETVAQFKHRTGGRDMNQITSDEHRPYKEVICRRTGSRRRPPDRSAGVRPAQGGPAVALRRHGPRGPAAGAGRRGRHPADLRDRGPLAAAFRPRVSARRSTCRSWSGNT